jgi:hypothetical protein
MTQPTTVSLADLITTIYDEYLALYGDKELASVAAAATVNDILAERAQSQRQRALQVQAA